MEPIPVIPDPVVEDGIDYWSTQPASYDGVLGGFGTGSLPRIDALDSRLFLLSLYPELSSVPSALQPINPDEHVGAGVGRVTSDVLLHLVSDVVLLEPVEAFVNEALVRVRGGASDDNIDEKISSWEGLAHQTRSVTVLQGTLQEFDPLNPHRVKFLDRVGYQPARPLADIGAGYDVIWCQWCMGHLSDADLVAFLRRGHAALRKDGPKDRSLIVVKENLCSDNADGTGRTVFDEQDSSLTRSDMAWKHLFKLAGLRIVKEQLQHGFPELLYKVKM
ncbi:methyltransferase domain-containing protein [Amanita rubescens]|nr:methyltransferase domain-containing protein [Amanita rubescens]